MRVTFEASKVIFNMGQSRPLFIDIRPFLIPIQTLIEKAKML